MSPRILDDVMALSAAMAGQRSSTAQDLARGRPSEIDHINGTLFIDHLSKLKRDMALRKSAKLKRMDK